MFEFFVKDLAKGRVSELDWSTVLVTTGWGDTVFMKSVRRHSSFLSCWIWNWDCSRYKAPFDLIDLT